MDVITQILSEIMNLSSAVLVPIVIFILAVCSRMRVSHAVKSSLLFGAGLIGLLTIVNLITQVMTPVADGLVTNTGISNTQLDVGMVAMFAGVSSLPFFIFLYPIGIVINLILLRLKWTKTVIVDFLNYFAMLIPILPIYLLTGNVAAALIGFAIHEALLLKVADIGAPYVQKYYGMEGVSISHASCGMQIIYVIPLNWLLDKIPVIRDIDINVDTVKSKLGFFGEPSIISAIIGLVLGLFAGQGVAGALYTAMYMAACVFIFPKMVGLMMEGLTPISQSLRSMMFKHLKVDQIYMGMDANILSGFPEVIAMGMIFVPIQLLMTFLLPGVKVLPGAESLILGIVFGMILPFAGKPDHKGNIFRTLIIGIILLGVGLYIMTYTAPLVTQLCQQAGMIGEGVEVCSGGMRDPQTGLIYYVMTLLGY